MNQEIELTMALCLSESDCSSLASGRSFTALSNRFINGVQQFAICPANASTKIEAWAELDSCRMFRGAEFAEALAWNTIWSEEFLRNLLTEKHHVFLNILRIHRLDRTTDSSQINSLEKVGAFLKLPTIVRATSQQPVLDDATFLRRKRQLDNLDRPPHPELEQLQQQISAWAVSDRLATSLDHDIQSFLGWGKPSILVPGNGNTNPDSTWISTIADVGNSSDGNGFEKLVRKSFVYLGFSNSETIPRASLRLEGSGGAGGLDFYCEAPYPVVGECKATQSTNVPSSTPGQLIKLGTNILQTAFQPCIKIILAAGKLTHDAELTANRHHMNLLRPETLQRLVDLKSKYPGSIDLMKLKHCLEAEPFGESADQKLNNHIDLTEQGIALRRAIFEIVRDGCSRSTKHTMSTETILGIYRFKNPDSTVNSIAMHRILVELSSPLSGYLGCNQCQTWEGDRFYCLRAFPMT
jgi:hypothetical protein